MKIERFDSSITAKLPHQEQRFWTESVEFMRDCVAFDAPNKRILLLRSDLVALMPLFKRYIETGSPDEGPAPKH